MFSRALEGALHLAKHWSELLPLLLALGEEHEEVGHQSGLEPLHDVDCSQPQHVQLNLQEDLVSSCKESLKLNKP